MTSRDIPLALVVLQNAYYDDGKARSKKAWLYGMWNSYTGKRLREMLPDGVRVAVINSTPEIGDTADSVFAPNPAYIKKQYEYYKPDVVIGCGKIAQKGLSLSNIDYVAAPHPAWRRLSKKITGQIRALVHERAKTCLV